MRSTTYLITGNPGKLRELQAVLPASLNLTHKDLDLEEAQSLDTHEIVSRKAREAYRIVGGPVIVEDVSAELASLNGLPGPFVKFFMQKLGNDSLYKLGGEGDRVTVRCTTGYYDGEREVITDGVMLGTITAPTDHDKLGSGFGFDSVIIPDGYDQTLYDLGLEVKNTLSHRYHAATKLADALKEII